MSGDSQVALRTPYPKRFLMLDIWRGLASFSIVLHHRYGGHELAIRELLGLGVAVFFVISGYCIAAATDSAGEKGTGLGGFMKRRVLRIAPPYMASVVVSILLGWIDTWRNRGFDHIPETISQKWGVYLQNLVMMQWVTPAWNWATGEGVLAAPWMNKRLLEGIYWSLNYEEQYYLLAGLLLLLPTSVLRNRLVLGGTVLIVAWNVYKPGLVTGIFFDYWAQFAVGVFLYWRLCKAQRVAAARAFDAGLVLALLAFIGAVLYRHEHPFHTHKYQYFFQMAVCLGFALVLLLLRRFDDAVADVKVLAPFRWLGAISYSLYLIHLQFLGALWPLDRVLREKLGKGWADVLMLITVLSVVSLFYFLFERPAVKRLREAREPVTRPVVEPLARVG